MEGRNAALKHRESSTVYKTGKQNDVSGNVTLRRTAQVDSPVLRTVVAIVLQHVANAMHAMLYDSILSMSRWAEALSAATNVQNRTPTKVLGGYEIYYGNRTSPIGARAHPACLVLSSS
jgi:hypothetical protein